MGAREKKKIATATSALRDLQRKKDELERLDLVRVAREALDELEQGHVDAARAAGYTWSDIADLYGLSRQGAQQRFRPKA